MNISFIILNVILSFLLFIDQWLVMFYLKLFRNLLYFIYRKHQFWTFTSNFVAKSEIPIFSVTVQFFFFFFFSLRQFNCFQAISRSCLVIGPVPGPTEDFPEWKCQRTQFHTIDLYLYSCWAVFVPLHPPLPLLRK